MHQIHPLILSLSKHEAETFATPALRQAQAEGGWRFQ